MPDQADFVELDRTVLDFPLSSDVPSHLVRSAMDARALGVLPPADLDFAREMLVVTGTLTNTNVTEVIGPRHVERALVILHPMHECDGSFTLGEYPGAYVLPRAESLVLATARAPCSGPWTPSAADFADADPHPRVRLTRARNPSPVTRAWFERQGLRIDFGRQMLVIVGPTTPDDLVAGRKRAVVPRPETMREMALVFTDGAPTLDCSHRFCGDALPRPPIGCNGAFTFSSRDPWTTTLVRLPRIDGMVHVVSSGASARHGTPPRWRRGTEIECDTWLTPQITRSAEEARALGIEDPATVDFEHEMLVHFGPAPVDLDAHTPARPLLEENGELVLELEIRYGELQNCVPNAWRGGPPGERATVSYPPAPDPPPQWKGDGPVDVSEYRALYRVPRSSKPVKARFRSVFIPAPPCPYVPGVPPLRESSWILGDLGGTGSQAHGAIRGETRRGGWPIPQ